MNQKKASPVESPGVKITIQRFFNKKKDSSSIRVYELSHLGNLKKVFFLWILEESIYEVKASAQEFSRSFKGNRVKKFKY